METLTRKLFNDMLIKNRKDASESGSQKFWRIIVSNASAWNVDKKEFAKSEFEEKKVITNNFNNNIVFDNEKDAEEFVENIMALIQNRLFVDDKYRENNQTNK